MENKEKILIVGHVGMGKALAAELLALKDNKDVIIIQDGKVVQGNPFPQRPEIPPLKIENPYKDLIEYSPVNSPKPKHHNSKWGPSLKTKSNKRKQQRKSRKINRRK